MLKKLMSGLLTLTLLLSMAPAASAYAWRMTGKSLVFTGTGEITPSNSWKQYQFAAATSADVQSGLTAVPSGAFAGMEHMTRVTMADTVTQIGTRAFLNCPALAEVQIPRQLSVLGEEAFKDCISLERIALPQSLKRIEVRTFSGCTRLKELELGRDISYIGAGAFKGCMRLSVFAVPERVTKIYPETFAYCSGLVQIYLPAGLQQIEADSFTNCNSLTDIYFGGTAEQWRKLTMEDETIKSGRIIVHYNAKTTDLDQNAQGSGKSGLRFDDVMPDYWGYNGIVTIAEHGLVTGTRAPDATGVGSFTPEGKVTLGQFLVVVTRLVCPEARKDTPGHWARGSYNAALETGILAKGDFADSDAALDAPLKRQNMAYILVRAARLKGESFTVHPDAWASIRDYGKIREDRRQAVLECYSNGIISGYSDSYFRPEETMTRAQMATVVCRLAGWMPRAEVKI